MPSRLLQPFITRRELAEIIDESRKVSGAWMIIASAVPDRRRLLVDPKDDTDITVMLKDDSVEFVILTKPKPMFLAITDTWDFVEQNKSPHWYVSLRFPEQSEHLLTQTMINVWYEETPMSRRAVDILIKLIRRATSTGAFVWSMSETSKSFQKSVRYSRGAKALYESGARVSQERGMARITF